MVDGEFVELKRKIMNLKWGQHGGKTWLRMEKILLPIRAA